jgi:hypothetical protein
MTATDQQISEAADRINSASADKKMGQ